MWAGRESDVSGAERDGGRDLPESLLEMTLATNGFDHLRGAILDMAVRGQLASADQDGGTADQLLARISARNALRAPASAGTLVEWERFELPPNWTWTTLGRVCGYIQRGKSPSYVDDSEVPVVSQKCVQWGGFSLDRCRFIDPKSLGAYDENRFLRRGDLLWNSTGHGTVGRIAEFQPRREYPKIVADSHVTVLRPTLAEPRWIWCWIASPTVQRKMDGLVSGTTKQTELATSTVRSLPLPLPPLADQKRIVAKVDRLMALCDELEAKQTRRIEAGDRVTAASLASLTLARRGAETSKAWSRVEGAFLTLFDRPARVGLLRNAAMAMAVFGRFTGEGQEGAERGALESAGSLDHLVGDVPRGWRVVPLGELSEVIDPNPSHRYPTYVDGVVPLLSTREFREREGWETDMADVPLVPAGVHSEQMERCRFSPTDIIMARKGRLGLARFPPKVPRFTLSHTMFVVKAGPLVSCEFLLWYLRLAEVEAWLRREMNDNTGVPTLGKATTERLPVPVPPLPEQERIVQKVEALVRRCDELERLLAARDKKAEMLASALVLF